MTEYQNDYANVKSLYDSPSDEKIHDSFFAYFPEKFTNPVSTVSFSGKSNDLGMGKGNEGDTVAVFAYGFLYALTPLNSNTYKLGSHTTDGSDWTTKSFYKFYSLTNFKGINIEDFLKNSKSLPYCGGDTITDSNHVERNSNSWSIDYFPCNLDSNSLEGEYFVMIDLLAQITDGNINNDIIESEINIARFVSEETSAYGADLNRADSIPSYVISQTRLTPEELNELFKENVENTTWLCKAAGGKIFSDVFGDVLPYEILDADTKSHYCCGDDINEKYTFDNDGKTYHCENKEWSDGTPKTMCGELVKPFNKVNYYYEDEANNKTADSQYKFYEIETGSLDGSDGCCGDDSSFKCELKKDLSDLDCSEFSNNENLCRLAGCTFAPSTCEFKDCSDFHSFSSGSCVDAPDYCYYDEYDDDCVNKEIPVGYCDDGTGGCKDSCSTISAECTGTVENDPCSNIKSFEECEDANSYCNPFEGNDLGYVSKNSRYFCNKDDYIKEGKENINYFDLDNNKVFWSWWDAREYDVPFKIHNIENVDYISNGEKWYYCGGSDTNPPIANSNAERIKEAQTFSLASDSGSFRCIDTLNQLSNFFKGDSFPGYFQRCENASDDTFCCSTERFKDIYYEAGYFGDSCYSNCYVNQELLEKFLSDDVKSSFTESFCNLFPSDTLCSSKIVGTVVLNEGGEGNSYTLLKDDCSFDLSNCLTPTVSIEDSCASIKNTRIGDERYNGILCNYNSDESPQYCVTGKYALTKDTKSNDGGTSFCCLTSAKTSYTPNTACISTEEEEMDPASCAETGGQYLSDASLAICSSPAGAIGGCCIGGKWDLDKQKAIFTDLKQNKSFICYQHGQDQRIAECCTDFVTCNNYDYGGTSKSIFNDLIPSQDNTYFGKGGSIHTLENFDNYELTTEGVTKLFDLVKIQTGVKRDRPFSLSFETKFRNNNDWSTFDFLEFDVGYNLNEIVNISLVDGSTNVCNYAFNEHLTNGNATMRWHHVVVNLSDNDCGGFNFSDVASMKLTTNYESGFSIVIDSIYLSGGSNTQNAFCTGNFGSWVSNLDGPTNDDGFIGSNPGFTTYGKYWYACESQASFDWSGHLCCGDDTIIPYSESIEQNQFGGEFYNDSSMGCFGGTPVYENWRVGDSLNDETYNDLLYFNGEFHSCNTNNRDLKITYDGKTISNSDLVTDTKKVYEVLGEFICGPEGKWLSVDEVPRARIIAAKLYNLTFSEGNNQYANYEIVCDSFDEVSPYSTVHEDKKSLKTLFNSDSITDFCTLKFTEGNQEKTLIGLSLSEPVRAFLDSIKSHVEIISDEDLNDEESDNFISACDDANSGFSTNDDFFKVCDVNVNNLKIAYNPDFKILFIAQSSSRRDFNSLFQADEGRIKVLFESFIDTFKNLFSNIFSSRDINDDFVINTNVQLPVLLSDSVSYQHIYLAGFGNKKITAYKTSYMDGKQSVPLINIEYDNFITVVKPIALNYYNKEDYSINYTRGNNKQIITIENPDSKHSFENEFDWRTLTTMLKINNVDGNSPITAANLNNDGVVDAGELCDYNNGNPVFKYSNLNCHFWDSSYPRTDANVSCTSDGEIDFSECS